MPKLKILHLFVFIALITVLLLPFYTTFVIAPLYTGFIVSETEKISENIAHQMASHLDDTGRVEQDTLSPDFIRKVTETIKILGLWKIRIYSPDGTITYSSELSETGGKTTSSFFPQIINNGTTHTRINKKEIMTDDGEPQEIELVESYVPIKINGETIGVFEIHHDISASSASLGILTSRSGRTTYLIASLLTLLIIFMLIKTNRSNVKTASAEKKLKIYSNRLEILRQIDAAILAIQTPEAIARIAIDHITGHIPYQRVMVYSYDLEEHKSFLLAAKSRPDKNLADIEPEQDLPELKKMMEGKVFIKEPDQNQIDGQDGHYTIQVPLLTGQDLVGSLELQCDTKIPIDDDNFQVVKEISAPLALAIQNGRLFASVDAHRRQLRTLAVRLSEMEEIERRKIAVELHDRVGQNLTALNINLNIIKSRMKAGMIDSAEVCITDSFLLIEETTEQIRDIMAELRPPNLDDHGLLAALRWYASQRTRRTGLQITVIGSDQAPRPALEVEMALFRIAQEALNNIIKHAKAHTATVKVGTTSDGQKTRLSIKDDGIGFAAKRGTGYHKTPSGLGIIAMQERVSALGGTFEVESSRGQGSTITVEV